MTKRTALPASPEAHVSRFVSEGMRIVARALRHDPALAARSARLRLACIVGVNNWQLTDDGEPGYTSIVGVDEALADAGRSLTKAVVSELHQGDRCELMRRMDVRENESGEPSFFRCSLTVDGESSWAVRVSACARGSSAVIADVQGTLIEPAESLAA